MAFSNAFEGEIIRKNDTQIEIDGSRVDCCEFCRTEEAQNIEDHAIILDGPDFDEFEPGSKICLTITLEWPASPGRPTSSLWSSVSSTTSSTASRASCIPASAT